ncbi:Oidioi.mRNA.OKI2018_I69.PAR.g10680.t1.cds [Oikopleura dioica]|uniref:Oidioi.mRNA.OKI2018_I69.PAR.g10680.t1.cds n=1 Tax=Oikopleura dioica TaxID=34765 RepID=A0ABN7RRV3_OIKDI|nr:Oidioi.mRNA.OKI2018_I69.PAR.g10680.t1.cds [Oikopleura dioica]
MKKNELWVVGSVDREIASTIKILIATRLKKESRFIEAFIHVLEENDQKPVIQPIGDIFVEEDYPVGMLLYRVEVTDLDETPFFEFSITKGKKFVSIERFSGFMHLRRYPFDAVDICVSVFDGKYTDNQCFFIQPANGKTVLYSSENAFQLDSTNFDSSNLTITDGFGEVALDYNVFLNKEKDALELSFPSSQADFTSIFIASSSISNSRTFLIAHQSASQTKIIPPADLGTLTLSKSWIPPGEILYSMDIRFERSYRFDENVSVEISPVEYFDAKFSPDNGRVIVYSRGFAAEEVKRIDEIQISIGDKSVAGTHERFSD